MTDNELKQIVERVNMLDAYKDKKFKSKEYTQEEIEDKRKYFLSIVPDKETGLTLQRWHYEIKRVFELSKTFLECPDMWFYHLETLAKYGI